MTKLEIINQIQAIQSQLGEIESARLQLLGRLLQLNDALKAKNKEDLIWFWQDGKEEESKEEKKGNGRY